MIEDADHLIPEELAGLVASDTQRRLKYEQERELNQQGYLNIVVREMTDALLRTVVEEDLVEEVANRFEQARESASSESEE